MEFSPLNDEEMRASANEAAGRLTKLIERRVLTIDPRAVPIVARCFMVDHRRFIKKLEQLCCIEGTEINLYPDGLPEELSFGILWYERPISWADDDGTKYYFNTMHGDHVDPAKRQKPYMVGGLIYTGPERAGSHYKEHSWTSHT